MKNQMAENIKVIHQFLLDHNFESTAEALIEEASRMGIQNLECKLTAITDPYAQLMVCYNTGDYSTFFQLWDDLFSDSIKQCEEYKKLTFYLHVYFAILPKCKSHIHGYKEHEQRGLEINKSSLSSMEDPTLEKCEENSATEIEKNIHNSMKQLRDYLSRDGKELEHDAELQSLYALPFMEDPRADALLSKISEQCWLNELPRNLDLFITNHRANHNQFHMTVPETKSKAPELIVMQDKAVRDNVLIVPNDRDIPIFLESNDDEEQYAFCHKTNRSLKLKGTQTNITGDQITTGNSREDKSNPRENVDSALRIHKQDKRLIQCNQELALTKTHLCGIRTSYEKLKTRFHKLHADYHKLVDVAGELTVALENSVKGQSVDIQRTLEICIKIFPDLFNQNIRETSYPSLLQLDRTDVKVTALPKLDITAIPMPAKLLDFRKIKLHLLNGDVKTKLLLLQALRWKITLAESTERDEVLHEYISRDLLGLHGQIASDNGKSVLPCLLTAGEAYARHLLQQFTARLLNTLASFRCGRDYLSVGSTVINATFACLDNNYADGVDSFACDMMVAMLQKLSLRRQQRIYMIESGLLEWLIDHLHDKCRVMSLYRLEYATALLMNVSLHRLAQARASKISSLLVSTLLVLLSIDHASSLPYINGALNNFLNNPIIHEEVKRIKCSNMSDYLGRNYKTTEIRKHLDHVLRIERHGNAVDAPQNEEAVDDDDEELDVLENELDENDPLRNYVGELNGEMLLAMCYSFVASKIPQDPAVTADTAPQKISVLRPIDFYDDHQHNDRPCSRRPSYPALRYNVETDDNTLPKESCTKQAVLTTERILSNSPVKERRIVASGASKKLLPGKVKSTGKGFVGTASSLIMKCKSRVYEKQDGELALKEDIIWPSSAINEKKHRCKPEYDNSIRMRTNPIRTNNNTQRDRLKSYISRDKIDIGKSHDGKFGRTHFEKFHRKAAKTIRRNFSSRLIPNDTVYLYKNQTSTDSSETAVTSSMILAPDRENGRTTETEKFSSIASLNINNHDSNVANDTSWRDDSELAKEEEAFLAKPKLSRTPP